MCMYICIYIYRIHMHVYNIYIYIHIDIMGLHGGNHLMAGAPRDGKPMGETTGSVQMYDTMYDLLVLNVGNMTYWC